jgi:hypothetical protein
MKKCKNCGKEFVGRLSVCSFDCAKIVKQKKDLEKQSKKVENKSKLLDRQLDKTNAKLMAKKSKSELKTAKKKAWELFSRYIRLKDADQDGNTKCVTCGKVDSYKKMQAGHAISGRGGRVLFEEKIVRPQCFYCNMVKNGRYDDFIYFLTEIEKSMTIEEYWEIKKESKLPCKLSLQDFIDVQEKYKQKIKELNKG